MCLKKFHFKPISRYLQRHNLIDDNARVNLKKKNLKKYVRRSHLYGVNETLWDIAKLRFWQTI